MVMDVGGPRPAFMPGGILYCPHIPETNCICRKPRPGLVLDAIKITGLDPLNILLVGDKESDIAAAHGAGCWSVHVRSGQDAPPVPQWPTYLGSFRDLLAVAIAITVEHRPQNAKRISAHPPRW
jgi:D-glycero-D-manno-heptose 1,7-bisphosphate phosphatase